MQNDDPFNLIDEAHEQQNNGDKQPPGANTAIACSTIAVFCLFICALNGLFSVLFGIIGLSLGLNAIVKVRKNPHYFAKSHNVIAAIWMGGAAAFIGLIILAISFISKILHW